MDYGYRKRLINERNSQNNIEIGRSTNSIHTPTFQENTPSNMDMNISFESQINVVSDNNFMIQHQYTKNIHISQVTNMNDFDTTHLQFDNFDRFYNNNNNINRQRDEAFVSNHGLRQNPINIYTNFGFCSSDVNNERRCFDYSHQTPDNVASSCDYLNNGIIVDLTDNDEEAERKTDIKNIGNNAHEVEDLSLMHYKVMVDKSERHGRISLEKWSKIEMMINPIFSKFLKKFPGPEEGMQVIGWQAGLKIVHFKNLDSIDLYTKAIKEAGEIWKKSRIALMPLSYVDIKNTVGLLLPKFPDKPQDILEVLAASNPNLQTRNWSVRAMQKAVGESRLVWLNLPKEDIKAIIKAGDFVHFGFANLKIIFNKKNVEENDSLELTKYKKYNSSIHERLRARSFFKRRETKRKSNKALAMKCILPAEKSKKRLKTKLKAKQKVNKTTATKNIKKEIVPERNDVDIKPIKQELDLVIATNKAPNRAIKNSDNDGQSNKENYAGAVKDIAIKIEKNVTTEKHGTKGKLKPVQKAHNAKKPQMNNPFK